MLASMMNDIDTTTRVLTFEFNRRISDSWCVHLEAIALLDVDNTDLSYPTRRDSFIELNLIYNH